MKNRNTFTASLLALLAVGLLASAAHADVVDLNPDADTYGQAGSNANTNYGTTEYLLAKNVSNGTPGTATRKTYMRFDISALTLAATPNATLKLDWVGFGTNAGQTLSFNVVGLKDGDVGESWLESGVGGLTWNNAPANITTSETAFDGARTTSLGTLTFNAPADGTQITFSSAALDAFLLADTDGQVTIMLSRVTASLSYNSSFASRENTTLDIPVLSVNTVPTPAALPAGLALLALAAMRRRK